jgi:site-specific recombinase XerD
MNSDKPILQLMDEFLANKDTSESSRKKYREYLHVFIFWLTRNGDVRDPHRSDIINYKQWLIQSGRAASSIDIYLSSVRQFFKYLEETGVHDDVAAGVHSPKRYAGYRKKPLPTEMVSPLLKSINRSSITGLRDYAIINLMVRTGMRCCEVVRTNVGDIQKEKGNWIIAIQGKGHHDKDRLLGLTDKVVNPITEYIESAELGKDDPLFLNHSYVSHNTRLTTLTISKFVKKYLRAIGIDSEKISAHSLRHTAAITALNNGIDVLAVQSMLGHKRIETTMIYQRAIEEERQREGTAVRVLDDAY